jgi:UDP-3-O-[3-hydroxymyristoyl] N-acetylglucosamine deacetylase
MGQRRTLAREVSAQGVTLHAGVPVQMRLMPAPSGAGISFRRDDIPGSAPIAALWSNVAETRLGTVLRGADGTSVGVVEHLLAALSGAEIDDCTVAVDGSEPPILDGDALSFLHLIDKAGVHAQDGVREKIRVLKPVEAAAGPASARLLPAPRAEYSFAIDFPSAAIGRQSFECILTPENFRKDIAPARTFGFLQEAEQLRAMGYGRGANLGNTLVVDGDRLMNPELKRFPDEFVRHKILDAIGDMKLTGAPLLARFDGRRSSHALNNALLRALFAEPANYERVAG